jgi:hypothetical protein
LEHKCTSAMWQVFLNHGWDINAEIHHKRPPPLAYISPFLFFPPLFPLR